MKREQPRQESSEKPSPELNRERMIELVAEESEGVNSGMPQTFTTYRELDV